MVRRARAVPAGGVVLVPADRKGDGAEVNGMVPVVLVRGAMGNLAAKPVPSGPAARNNASRDCEPDGVSVPMMEPTRCVCFRLAVLAIRLWPYLPPPVIHMLVRSTRAWLAVAVFTLSVNSLPAADWARFRGPNGTGVSPDTAHTPVKFSPTENLKWKTALPGPGSSCPIVVGDKVFVTCWSGYGVDRGEPGSQSKLKRHMVCVDRSSGKILWNTAVDAALPEDQYRGMFAENGYASHTPVSDGKNVYAFFGKSGAVAFDMTGKQLWQTKVGSESDRRGWGSSSSPVLYENLVIVTASAESQALVGLDKETGKEVWRKEAQGFGGTWGTPVLVKVDDTRTDLVLAVPYEIWGFDPATGKLRWFCEAMNTDSFCSSVTAEGNVVYAVEGMGGGSIAVRVGGMGDVTKTNVVWSGRHNSRISTPLFSDGRIYFINSGVANCLDAASGEKVYKERLSGGGSAAPPAGGSERRGGGRRGGQNYSSPVAADGKLYYVSRGGDVSVVKLGAEFELLATNRVTEDTEDFSASPAISNGEIFLRSSKNLYCVGEK